MIVDKKSNEKLIFIFSCIYVGGFFIFTAYSKIIDPGKFIAGIRLYKLIPDPFNTIMGLSLPWLEMICGLGIIFGIYRRASTILIIMMLIMFIIALSQAKIRGLEINCQCFGGDPDEKTDLLKQINIDIMLLLISFWILLVDFKKPIKKNT